MFSCEFLRASVVLSPFQNIINIVSNPEEIKLKEFEKKYKSLLLAAIVDHHEYEEDNIAKSYLPTGSIPRYIVISYLLLRTQVRCTLFYENDTNKFLIILQGLGFRDQNKDFDAFLASSYIWRGRGRGGLQLLGGGGGYVSVCLPFFLFIPVRMFQVSAKFTFLNTFPCVLSNL